jgi:uncharacterized protein (TIGR02246 family)
MTLRPIRHAVLLGTVLAAEPAIGQTAAEATRPDARPCLQSSEHRRFAFWIGDWDVTSASSATTDPPARSHIEWVEDGCVILEEYRAAGGYSGRSLNAYHPDKRHWEQFWVDNAGSIHHYVGGFRDGRLHYEAEGVRSPGPSSPPARARMTLFDQGPGRVRQLGEQSTDGGTTWAVSYDLVYRRRPPSPESTGCPTRADPADVERARAVATGIIEADNLRDIDRVLDLYADDAVLLPPNEPPVTGKDKIRPRYETLFAGFDPGIAGRVDQVCLGGPTSAFVRGHNGGRMVARGGGKDRTLDDTYLMLLRRDPGQGWRISHLIWH